MKTYAISTIIIFLFLSFNKVLGQNSCKVILQPISESYEGGCKNGLAHGKGIAKGTDKYEGKFKNGLPEGRGTYFWSTGEYYVGTWKAGKRNGKGKFHFKMNGADSVRYGYWENDLFVKKIPVKPYKVTRSNSVVRYTIRKVGEGNQVVLTIMQNGGISTSYRGLNVNNSSGYYFSDGNKFGYDNIIFPFECEINYTMPTVLRTSNFEVDFDFEINEPGQWEVIIHN